MKKIFVFVLILIIIINCCGLSAIQASAHAVMLTVDYDECVGANEADGINEMWYMIDRLSACEHLSHEINTIKYYFAEGTETDTNVTWADLVMRTSLQTISVDEAEQIAKEIKEAYASSMEKWNNVYFYSYDSSGKVVKNKIVNVVEGTLTDHNLIVYPSVWMTKIAVTQSNSEALMIEEGTVNHIHYSSWKMQVNIAHFFESVYDADYVNAVRTRNGAHELGHVLGLFDIDKHCSSSGETGSYHHEEVLMGYGDDVTTRVMDITYKDIAGVAVIRGFHTDNDHQWLNMGQQSDGTYKLLCSICNGVKYVSSLNGYSCRAYGGCNNNHNLSSDNMMAVASYGDKDYYKCKYCRYVAPFSTIVSQNYVKIYYSDTQHQCTNVVTGLKYEFYEEHNMVDGECTECEEHTHSYTFRYLRRSDMTHWSYCVCGDRISQPHVVSTSHSTICIICNGTVSGGLLNSIPSDYPHTENGSYILPNGIIVLVPEDEEAYLNGTLVFRTGEIM